MRPENHHAQKLAAAVSKTGTAAFNERLKTCDGTITALANQYNKGCRLAQVECDIRYNNPEPGKKSYWRMDRNELVETHDMSWEEKQEEIQFGLNIPPAGDTPAPPDDLEKAMGMIQDPAPAEGESREEFERDRNPPKPPEEDADAAAGGV